MGTQHFKLEIISYFMNDQPVLCYFQGLHNTFLKTLRNKEKEDIWINGKCNILIVTMVQESVQICIKIETAYITFTFLIYVTYNSKKNCLTFLFKQICGFRNYEKLSSSS